MNYLKQALTEYLSGLTTKKNDKEIWTHNEDKNPITVEPIDDEKYIIRCYYKDGRLWWEKQFKNDQLHGTRRWWDRGGTLCLEESYEDERRIY